MQAHTYIEDEDGEIIAVPDPEKLKELRQKKYEYFLGKSGLPNFIGL